MIELKINIGHRAVQNKVRLHILPIHTCREYKCYQRWSDNHLPTPFLFGSQALAAKFG
jgi:hypothetical protein